MILYLVGYITGEYRVELNEPAPSLSIEFKRRSNDNPYTVEGFYTHVRVEQPGWNRPLLNSFVPCRKSAKNEIAACIHRFGSKNLNQRPARMRHFVDYCKHFIHAIPNLHDSDVPEYKKWLSDSSYTGSRKEYFRRLRSTIEMINRKTYQSDSFIKLEGYEKPKQPRAINSYSDVSKTLLGPIVKAMDKKLFTLKYFVKGTNPRDWPKKMFELFGHNPVLNTDFKSFEAHHHGQFAYIGYYYMMHMTRNLTASRELRKMIGDLIMGRNDIKFRCCNVAVDQRLMSGALWTSSMNGLLNLLLMSYMSLCAQHPNLTGQQLFEKLADFTGLVEGDDGICLDVDIPDVLKDELGLRLKWEKYKDYSSAGFCSIYCSMGSDAVMKEPLRVIRDIYLLDPKYLGLSVVKKLSLLRCKALSIAYAYPGAPIVTAVCHHILSRTRSLDVRHLVAVLDARTKENVEKALEFRWKDLLVWPTMEDRRVAERNFKISLDEQYRIEEKFMAAGDVVELDMLSYADDDMLDHAIAHIMEDPKSMGKPREDYVDPLISKIFSTGRLDASIRVRRREVIPSHFFEYTFGENVS